MLRVSRSKKEVEKDINFGMIGLHALKKCSDEAKKGRH
jgi:hypothetical protein